MSAPKGLQYIDEWLQDLDSKSKDQNKVGSVLKEMDDCNISLDEHEVKHDNDLNEVVTLNVGGIKYCSTVGTLSAIPGTMLDRMFNGHFPPKTMPDGSYFIDRDGRHFGDILNFLRDARLTVSSNSRSAVRQLLYEAQFYQIQPLIATLEQMAWLNDIGSSVLQLSHVRPLWDLGLQKLEPLSDWAEPDFPWRYPNEDQCTGALGYCRWLFLQSRIVLIMELANSNHVLGVMMMDIQRNKDNSVAGWKGMIFQTKKFHDDIFETVDCSISLQYRREVDIICTPSKPMDLFGIMPVCKQVNMRFYRSCGGNVFLFGKVSDRSCDHWERLGISSRIEKYCLK